MHAQLPKDISVYSIVDDLSIFETADLLNCVQGSPPDHSHRRTRETAPASIVQYDLELKFECQLDRSRAANLIQRIQSAALTAASQKVCQRRCRLPE